jgi:hypothetical protein
MQILRMEINYIADGVPADRCLISFASMQFSLVPATTLAGV